MTAQAPVSCFDTSQARRSLLRRLVDVIMESRRSKAEEIVAEYVRAHPELKCDLDPSSSVVMRYGELAVIWRNAQRARSELLGFWFFWFFSSLRKLIVAARQIIAQWRQRVRLRNELTTLSDGDLRDISWTRAEVEAERRKPFWRA